MHVARPRNLIGGLAILVVAVLTRNIVPVELWLLIGGVVVLGVAVKYVDSSNTGLPVGVLRRETIDDLDDIQDYLEERVGHYRFDLWKHDETVNEDTLEKDLGGEQQTFYAVVGVRYNPADRFEKVQLFVWNQTKQRKHAYYRNIHNSNLEADPLYRHYKRRFLKAEGRADPDRGDPWTGTNINIDQSPPPQRGD